MKKHVLFIQGGDDGGYQEDAKLVASLQRLLGTTYQVHYPRMPSDEALPDFGWLQQIGKEISLIKGEITLVGHSLGASMLLKYLSEIGVRKKIAGVFLLSTPFWSGEEEWKQGLKLYKDFASKLPAHVPVFLYHSEDDEVVPFGHLKIYIQHLPQATVRKITAGGHQLNNDLSTVAMDIQAL